MVKNPPSSARDAGSILGRGTKVPHAAGQLSPRATAAELGDLNWRTCVPQTTESMHPGAHVPQQERSPSAAMKRWRAVTKDPACLNEDPVCRN